MVTSTASPRAAAKPARSASAGPRPSWLCTARICGWAARSDVDHRHRRVVGLVVHDEDLVRRRRAAWPAR